MLFKESLQYRNEREKRRDAEIGFHHGNTNNTLDLQSKVHLHQYTGIHSSRLNRKLIHDEPLSMSEEEVHDTIHQVKRPLGVEQKFYSGTGHDFGKMGREATDGIIHSPAHISMTHSYGVAHRFSTMLSSHGHYANNAHMMVIHAKPSDKVVALGHTINDYEHETIIPSGAKLKYLGTKVKRMPYNIRAGHDSFTPRPVDEPPVNMFFHHFTIHSQE